VNFFLGYVFILKISFAKVRIYFRTQKKLYFCGSINKERSINDKLNAKMMQIIWLNEVDSTNHYAALHHTEAPEGSVWAAHVQTAGRGQQHNSWESEPYQNLTFSLLLHPDWLPGEAQFYIAKVVSVGIVDFLRQHDIAPSIKWPNDIYAGAKKIAGVLIENHIAGNVIGSSIVGIGLNVNQQQFLSDAPNPTSMRLENGRRIDLQQALPDLVACILQRYEGLRAGFLQSIDADYLAHLYRLNEWHWFGKKASVFRAKIVGLRPSGELLLEDTNGETASFAFKEIRFLNGDFHL
jgi:BirA family biotin operon repressor/biotin-[acetyl-CoA-carboxylase] ligase